MYPCISLSLSLSIYIYNKNNDKTGKNFENKKLEVSATVDILRIVL